MFFFFFFFFFSGYLWRVCLQALGRFPSCACGHSAESRQEMYSGWLFEKVVWDETMLEPWEAGLKRATSDVRGGFGVTRLLAEERNTAIFGGGGGPLKKHAGETN